MFYTTNCSKPFQYSINDHWRERIEESLHKYKAKYRDFLVFLLKKIFETIIINHENGWQLFLHMTNQHHSDLCHIIRRVMQCTLKPQYLKIVSLDFLKIYWLLL